MGVGRNQKFENKCHINIYVGYAYMNVNVNEFSIKVYVPNIDLV